MSLTQQERITISGKIVQIPLSDKQADVTKAQLEVSKQQAQLEDDTNKKLMDDKTLLINLYQNEFQRLDANGRNPLLESDIQNSSNRQLRNFFFPNDITLPIPITLAPDGIWKNFVPFAGSAAIGKNYDETYTTVQKEQDLIDDINAKIVIVEAFQDSTRSSGKECVTSGSCSGETPAGSGIDQPTCVANGGVWTPGPDIIQPSPTMQTAATDLQNAIQAWEDFINVTFSSIPSAIADPDPTRLSQNNTARTNITATITSIDNWQALQAFDTVTSTPTTCAAFDVFPASSFSPNQFRSTELNILKTSITIRMAFIITRLTELNTNLGGVTQDLSLGDILTATGFYGQRFRIINMRLNALGGSLTKLNGLVQAQNAQEEIKKSNANSSAVYTSLITTSQFTSPAGNHTSIHVKDTTGFNVSDTVYVASETQTEIQTTIIAIDNNRVVLANTIPSRYRHTELARLYKVL